MKKNLIIAILSIVSISSIVFGFYQRKLAQEAKVLAMENQVRALEMKRDVEQARTISLHQAREAMRQREAVQLANQNLQEALAQLRKAK